MAELKQIVRIVNADIVGTKPIYHALRKIQGISYAFSNAICAITGFDKAKKVGSLTAAEVKKIEDIIKNPLKYKIPPWLFNRKRDLSTGEDLHLVAADLKLKKEFDIKRLKNIKAYRGMRHAAGLPVRGQRTKGHFRTGVAVGVVRKGIKMVKEEEEGGRAARLREKAAGKKEEKPAKAETKEKPAESKGE